MVVVEVIIIIHQEETQEQIRVVEVVVDLIIIQIIRVEMEVQE